LLVLLIGPAAAQVTPGNQPLSIAKGGTSAGTRSGAFSALAPAPTRAGDISYWNGSAWVTVPGNNSGSQILTENASGVPSWTTPGGTGTMTSAQVSAGSGVAISGTCNSTSALNCTVSTATGAANTIKGSVNGTTTSDLAIASCSALYNFTQWISGTGWQCGINPVLPSRAVAATLNLSAFTSVTTQGYATPGDGGGATFTKLGAGVPFKDTYISGLPSITTAGSGLVNGTYLGVALGGGSGTGCSGSAVVAGNVLTSISIVVPCQGFKVGDVLTIVTAFIGGSGIAPTLTVGAISTPQASFTDASSNNFQFVTDQSGVANVMQFGAKGDWVGSDAGATNNAAAIWSAASWASTTNGASAAQVYGNQILFPRGAYMTCGAWNGTIYNIPIPQGVRFTGPGVGGATLMECAADSSANHYIELCDSNAKTGQYGCKVENMTINLAQVTTSTGGIGAIYSNSGQQFVLGENLEIQPGGRGCVKYEIGKGGAANDTWINIDCEMLANSTTAGFSFNASSTQHYLLHSVIGCVSGCTVAISHLAGRLVVDGLDVEAFVTGLSQNVSIGGNNSVYRNVQQNSNNCTQAIQLVNTNTSGNILFENVATGCPTTISNGQSGGVSFTTNIVKQITCVSGACS
jgi:hypothetical protein